MTATAAARPEALLGQRARSRVSRLPWSSRVPALLRARARSRVPIPSAPWRLRARALLSQVPAPRTPGSRGTTDMCSLAWGATGGYPGASAPGSPSPQAAPPWGWGKTPFLPLRPPGRGPRAVGPAGGWGRCGEGRRGAGRAQRSPAVEPSPTRAPGSRWRPSGSDRLLVLGGRGAVEDEREPPDLSDSGDEAAWEDEDEAELPHDKQQTPCLFCDRFVHLGAGLQPQAPAPRGSRGPVPRQSGLASRPPARGLQRGLVEKEDPQWSRGRSHELEAGEPATGLSFPCGES